MEGVQHFIHEILPIKPGPHQGIGIEKSAPQHMLDRSNYAVWGEGTHVSGAITDWLHNLVNVMGYQPHYKKQ